MAISRGQMPRQMYGLGSFVKKAVKGVTGAIKSVAKSDVGKLALTAGALYGLGGLGGATGFGRFAPSALKTGLLGTIETGGSLYGGGLLSGLMNTGFGQAAARCIIWKQRKISCRYFRSVSSWWYVYS
jgi:hypothetical protein